MDLSSCCYYISYFCYWLCEQFSGDSVGVKVHRYPLTGVITMVKALGVRIARKVI